MTPMMKLAIARLVEGAVQHKLSSLAGVAIAGASASVPAIQTGGESYIPASLEDAAVQLIGAVIGLALIYFNPNKNSK